MALGISGAVLSDVPAMSVTKEAEMPGRASARLARFASTRGSPVAPASMPALRVVRVA
jgi:hypothetical protein